MTLAHSSETLAHDSRLSREASESRRRPRRIRALASAAIHALPDEVIGLRDTFRQARTDLGAVRAISEIEPDRVSRLDVVKYMAWRYGVATPYQIADDIPGLKAFTVLKEAVGTPLAYVAVNAGSTALAFAIGMGERKAQQQKAYAQDLPTVPYDGPMGHAILDATVTSAPWNVMQTASSRREEGEPVQIMTPAQIATLSESYGAVNTAFYAGSTAIPGLDSWAAFGASLAVMYQVKGTIRGYQERMADTPEDGQDT